MSNVKVGHKQNVNKVWKSENLMKGVLQNARNAKLDQISKILLSDEDVEYLHSIGVETISLGESYETIEQAKRDLGNVEFKQKLGEEASKQILLKPYTVIVKPH